jgi:hypothetical protein
LPWHDLVDAMADDHDRPVLRSADQHRDLAARVRELADRYGPRFQPA